jgi:nitric oxide reductase subunit B
MKYQSQAVAKPYFLGALLIFALQLVFGLIGATIYVAPTIVPVDLLPFSVVRMIHTNALIVWLLLGFFGSTYYLLPEEAERELFSPKLAIVQFWIFFVAAAVCVVGYLFGFYDGRSYLEQPMLIKVGIVIVALMFLFNCSMTVLNPSYSTHGRDSETTIVQAIETPYRSGVATALLTDHHEFRHVRTLLAVRLCPR